jgi:tight adherence protein C
MTIFSTTILGLFAAAIMGCAGSLEMAHRRAMLLRLRQVAGDPSAATPRGGFSAGLLWLGAHFPGASDGTLRAALVRAGYFHPSALPVFIALRLLCTGAVLAFILLQGRHEDQAQTILLAIGAAFLCSRLFVILLKVKTEARQRAIRSELPPVVDVLLMVLNSGVSIDQCLRYVTGMLELTAPHTSVVFKQYIADIGNGMPYEAAFERMGQRLAIEEGYDLASLIKHALLQGGEIMASLDRFGEEVAEKRVSLAREQIGRRSILLTIIMLAFFMPVLLIILGGPAVSNITETLATVKQQLHAKGAHK